MVCTHPLLPPNATPIIAAYLIFNCMQNITFNEVPELVGKMYEELAELRALILKLQPPAEPENNFLTIKEAAVLLNLAVPTLYTKVNRGEIPHMKTGKKLMFSRAELMDFVRSGRKKTNAEIEAEARSYVNSTKKRGGMNGEF